MALRELEKKRSPNLIEDEEGGKSSASVCRSLGEEEGVLLPVRVFVEEGVSVAKAEKVA